MSVYENIDETDPSSNSTISIIVDSHINDIALSDETFALLDNNYLLQNLYINFLLVKSAQFEALESSEFFKLSNSWLRQNINERYEKTSVKLVDLLSFDHEQDRESLSKSLRFEDSDSDIYELPLQAIEMQIPMVYSEEGQLFDDNVYLIVYMSPDEGELAAFDSLSLKEKNYLNSFFSGVNFVSLVESQQINDLKLAYYDESAGSYWQTDVIKDTNERIFGSQTFSSREVLTKYYEFILNKEKEQEPFERKRMRNLFIELKQAFFITKPDGDCVIKLKQKLDDMVEEYAGKFSELSIVSSALGFVEGVNQQLSQLPLLQTRQIGDIRIQRQTLNFLEGINVGLDNTVLLGRQIQIRDINTYSDVFHTSDDDGSVELYFMVNKTNLAKRYSNYLLRFPNLIKYIPNIESFFSINSVDVFRGDRKGAENISVFGLSNQDKRTLIGRFKFDLGDTDSKNQNTEFFGNFVGNREIFDLVTTTTSITEGTVEVTETVDNTEEGEVDSDTTTTTATREIEEVPTRIIQVSTNGFATALAHFDDSGDEIILFCLNDQSVNASTGDPSESIVSVSRVSSMELEGGFTTISQDDAQENQEAVEQFADTEGLSELFLGYKFVHGTTDSISKPIVSLYKNLVKVIEQLEEYEREASEKCSFNDIASKFNDFFIDQQYRKYPELSTAPWNTISSALAMHATLFNRQEVEQNQLLFNAKQIKRKLDPKSSSLQTIGLVLDSSRIMADTIKAKLISINAMFFDSRLAEYNSVLHTTSAREYPGVYTSPDKLHVAKLSQFDGVHQVVADPVENIDTVFVPPTLDVLLGQFVMLLKPAINSYYRSLNNSTAYNNSEPGAALGRLAWWVINKRDFLSNNLPGSGNMDSRGRMKLNLIAPYRNTTVIDQEFNWRNNSMKIKGRFEAIENNNIELKPGTTDIYSINFSDFNRQRLEFPNTNDSYRSIQRMTYNMLTAEDIHGVLKCPTGRIEISTQGTIKGAYDVSTTEEPEYMRYYLSEFSAHRLFENRNSGNDKFIRSSGWGSSQHHIAFYSGNTKISHKCAHNDFNTGNVRDYLNEYVFKNNRSSVNDRDALNANNSDQVNKYNGGLGVEIFRQDYLVAFATVFSEVDFGEGFIPTTQILINGNLQDNLFVRLYRSGFYPWPGFPDIPDSIGLGMNEFIG